ncbi:MAG TPA: tetratricopeptide repeat protein [Planctomycetota bacterium]
MDDLKKGLKESREFLSKGQHREALARLMHLTEKYPDDRDVKSAIAAALNLRGIAEAEKGDMDRAGVNFERSLGYQENADAHVSLGRLHQSKGEFQEAFQEYTKALDLDEDLGAAHEYLGYYFLEVGDPEQAVTAFGRAIAKGLSSKHIYLGLWEAYMGLERKEQAHEAILTISQELPEDDQVLGTLGLSFAVCQGDYDQAEEAWKRAIGINPRNLSSLFNLAGLAAVRGRRKEAMDYLQLCVNIDKGKTLAMWKEDIGASRQKFAAYAGDEDFLDILGVTSN